MPYRFPLRIVTLFIIQVLTSGPAAAADQTWTNASTTPPNNFSWNDPLNWTTAVPMATDLALFTTTGAGIVTLDADQTVKGLVFANVTGNYTIASGTSGPFVLTVGSSGIVMNPGTPATTISANLSLNGNQTWSTGGGLTVSGNVGGTGNLIKADAATLILSGTGNTFAGTTTINAGAIQYNDANALSPNSTITVNAATIATLNFANVANTDLAKFDSSSAGTIALTTLSGSNDLSLAALPNASLGAIGTVTYAGVITPGASGYRFGGGGGTLTLTGNQSTASSLNVNGNGTGGTVVLGGSNAFTGTTTVTTGVLRIGNGAAAGDLGTSNSVTLGTATILAFNRTDIATAPFVYSGTISGSGDVNITSGTVTLSGDNSHSDGTGITNVAGTGNATAGARLNIGHVNAIGTGTLTVRAPNAPIFWDNTTGSELTLPNNPIVVTSGGTASIFEFVGTNAMNTGSGTLTWNSTNGYLSVGVGAAPLTIGGALVGASTAVLSKGGAGSLILSAASPNYNGTIQSGINTSITHFAVPNRSGPLLTTVAVLGFGTKDTVVTTNTAVLGFLHDTDATFTNGVVPYNVTLPSGTTPVVGLTVGPAGSNTAPRTLTIGNLVTNLGSGMTINVTGSFGYSLQVGSFSNNLASGNASNVTFNPTTATIRITDYTTALANNNTITLGGTSTGNVVSGAISITSASNMVLVKNNTSSWSLLSVASTYPGTSTISQGELRIVSLKNVSSGASSLGAPLTAANGIITLGSTGQSAQLTYIGTGDTTDRVVNLAGSGSTGILDHSGTNLWKFAGNITATGTSTAGRSLILQGSSSGIGEIGGVISNNTATLTTTVTKLGTGTWILSGNTTYNGLTTVSAGTLLVNGTHTPLSANTGAYLINGTGTLGGSGTLGGTSTQTVTVDTTGSVAPGNAAIGTLTSSKAVSFASGAKLITELGAASGGIGASDMIALTGASGVGILNFANGSVLSLVPGTGFDLPTNGTNFIYTVATVAATTGDTNLIVNTLNPANNSTISTYDYTTATSSGPITIDVSALPAYGPGSTFTLSRSGDSLILTANMQPVPEPAAVLGTALLGLVAMFARRRSLTEFS